MSTLTEVCAVGYCYVPTNFIANIDKKFDAFVRHVAQSNQPRILSNEVRVSMCKSFISDQENFIREISIEYQR